jgi:poly(A) polymerase
VPLCLCGKNNKKQSILIFEIKEKEKHILETIGKVADTLSLEAYVIGGYVRDKILGRPNKDIDIVCIGSGIQLAEAAANLLSPRPNVVVYARFGTAMFKHQDFEVEFVGARKESYRQDSRKPAVENGSLEDDQNRRDFTINAMAMQINAQNFGMLLDPFNGTIDLQNKRIRTPLDPDKTFSDDPLRMMRGIRFANQLSFTIDQTTLDSIEKNKHRLDIVSKERILIELEKIMACEKPSVGLFLLHQTGLLKIIIPELIALEGTQNIEGIGHKDNFVHTLQVVDNISRNTNNIWLRWAALFHDIGKPASKRFSKEIGWSFHGHQEIGAAMVPKLFSKLSLPNDNRMRFVQKIVKLHHRPISVTKENITDSAIRRLLFDAGEDIDDLMILCEADITTKSPDKMKRYLENYELVRVRLKEVEEKDEIRNWQPPISGELIMEIFGLQPGKEIGLIKNAIREAILDGIIGNNYEEAYLFMLEEGKKLNLVKCE